MTPSRLLVTVAAATLIAAPARAQTLRRAPAHPSRLASTVTFLAGAAAGLGLHESGHVLFGAAFGAHPTVRRLDYGPIPFFAIHHDQVSRREEFVISSAGLWVQSADSEWLLTRRPGLRDERAPLLKGILAFNLVTSAVYGVSRRSGNWVPPNATREACRVPGQGRRARTVDWGARAGAGGAGRLSLPEPDAQWAATTSRAVKIASVLLTIWAGRH